MKRLIVISVVAILFVSLVAVVSCNRSPAPAPTAGVNIDQRDVSSTPQTPPGSAPTDGDVVKGGGDRPRTSGD